MKKKILIIIIVMLIALCSFYAISNFQKLDDNAVKNGTIHDNGTLADHQDIWTTSSNVDLTYGEDGTHFNGKNNESCWISLISNGEQLFIDSKKDFNIEMDIKSNNMIAIYIIESLESNGDIYIVPNLGSNDFHHLKFDHNSSKHEINYSIDGNNVKNINGNFTNKLIGFKIIDWQGDMNLVIRNVTISNN